MANEFMGARGVNGKPSPLDAGTDNATIQVLSTSSTVICAAPTAGRRRVYLAVSNAFVSSGDPVWVDVTGGTASALADLPIGLGQTFEFTLQKGNVPQGAVTAISGDTGAVVSIIEVWEKNA